MIDFVINNFYNARTVEKTGSYSVFSHLSSQRGDEMSVTPARNSTARRGLTRAAVIGALMLGVLGVSAAPAMASTDTGLHATALPLQTVRQVNHGWAGQDYYFSRNESKNISAGAGYLVGWKLGGPVLGMMVAMWNQQGQNNVDDGQCLHMRTWGVFSAFPTWSVYRC